MYSECYSFSGLSCLCPVLGTFNSMVSKSECLLTFNACGRSFRVVVSDKIVHIISAKLNGVLVCLE